MMYTFVKFPDFVTKGPLGEVLEIRCKVCGVPIAGMTEKLENITIDQNGIRHEVKIRAWTKFHNYIELKMGFEDKTAHITHGCNKCITKSLTINQLDELHVADIEEQSTDLNREHVIELQARMPEVLLGVKPGGGMI